MMNSYKKNDDIEKIKVKLKSEFNFIDEKVLDDLWIEHLADNDSNKENISDYLESLIYLFLKEEFNKGRYLDYATRIISSYFAQTSLDKLNDLSLIIQYNPTFEEIKNLLNIGKINIFIKEMVNQNYAKIKDANYSFISNNELLQSLVDAYCELNNIINYDEIENVVDTYISSQSSLSMLINDIRRYKLLTEEEERFLFTELANGNTAVKERIINSNLRLVVYIASKYIKYNAGSNCNFELVDLIQEGSIGLMTAVDKYDLSRGVKFSTHAGWWIKQAIKRAIDDKASLVRIPVLTKALINRIRLYKAKVFAEEHRYATDEEIMTEFNLSPERLKQLKNVMERNFVSTNQTMLGYEEETELGDFIPDGGLPLEEEVMQKMEREYVWKLLDSPKLDDRSREVIKYRYGLYGRIYSMREVGEIFNISRERVRQIEVSTLKKLKQVYSHKKTVKQASSGKTNLPKKQIKKIEASKELDVPTPLTCNDIKEEAVYEEKVEEKEREEMNNTNGQKEEKVLEEAQKVITNDEVLASGKDLSTNQPLQKQGKKRTDNIYDYYSEYSYSEINQALSLLAEDDMRILYLKYGQDLANPVLNTNMTKEEKKMVFSSISKLGNALRCIREGKKYIPKSRKKQTAGANEVKQELAKTEENTSRDTLKTNNATEVSSSAISSKIDIYQMFGNDEFIALTKSKDIKELVILSLYLGYVNGIHFSPNVIADFLDLKLEDVNNIIVTNLKEYKELLLRNIDNEIEKLIKVSTITHKSKKLTKENK